MGARSCCSGSHRTEVSLARTTAHLLDPPGVWFTVPHPVMLHHWSAGGDVHDNHLVLPATSVLAGDLRDHEDVTRFPGTKPCRIVVSWGILLSEDVAGDVLRNLIIGYLVG